MSSVSGCVQVLSLYVKCTLGLSEATPLTLSSCIKGSTRLLYRLLVVDSEWCQLGAACSYSIESVCGEGRPSASACVVSNAVLSASSDPCAAFLETLVVLLMYLS